MKLTMRLAVLSLMLTATACGEKKSDKSDDKGAATDAGGTDTGTDTATDGSDPEKKVDTSKTGTLALSIDALPIDIGTALGLADEDTRSFTPVSYSIPIKSIYTSTQASAAIGTASGSGESLYTCASDDESECSLDLLDATALAAKLGSAVAIPVGTYKSIGYSFACGTVPTGVNSNGQGIHVAVKGTVAIAGTTYYTSAGAEVLTTDETLYAPAKLAMGGCGGKVYNLDADLVIEEGKTYKASLLLSADSIAWASVSGGAANPAGCVYSGTPEAAANGICTNLPAIIPVLGEFKSKTETYVVSEASYCGNALMTFVLNAESDEALGVFLSRYYADGLPPSPGSCWDAGVDLFQKNADGSFTIGADTTAPTNSPRVKFDAFTRSAHSGVLSHDQSGTLAEGKAYTATPK